MSQPVTGRGTAARLEDIDFSLRLCTPGLWDHQVLAFLDPRSGKRGTIIHAIHHHSGISMRVTYRDGVWSCANVQLIKNQPHRGISELFTGRDLVFFFFFFLSSAQQSIKSSGPQKSSIFQSYCWKTESSSSSQGSRTLRRCTAAIVLPTGHWDPQAVFQTRLISISDAKFDLLSTQKNIVEHFSMSGCTH